MEQPFILKISLQRGDKESIFRRPHRRGSRIWKKMKKDVDRGCGEMIYSSSTVRKGSEEVL